MVKHEYVIVRAEDTDKLAEKVIEKYGQGYICLGGVAVDSWEAGVEYLQAMYRWTNLEGLIWKAEYISSSDH
jgi:hypothetical protein